MFPPKGSDGDGVSTEPHRGSYLTGLIGAPCCPRQDAPRPARSGRGARRRARRARRSPRRRRSSRRGEPAARSHDRGDPKAPHLTAWELAAAAAGAAAGVEDEKTNAGPSAACWAVPKSNEAAALESLKTKHEAALAAHHAEAEACDLLMEVEQLEQLQQYVDDSAYNRSVIT